MEAVYDMCVLCGLGYATEMEARVEGSVFREWTRKGKVIC